MKEQGHGCVSARPLSNVENALEESRLQTGRLVRAITTVQGEMERAWRLVKAIITVQGEGEISSREK